MLVERHRRYSKWSSWTSQPGWGGRKCALIIWWNKSRESEEAMHTWRGTRRHLWRSDGWTETEWLSRNPPRSKGGGKEHLGVDIKAKENLRWGHCPSSRMTVYWCQDSKKANQGSSGRQIFTARERPANQRLQKDPGRCHDPVSSWAACGSGAEGDLRRVRCRQGCSHRLG